MQHTELDGPARALKAIEAGGHHIVATTHRRIGEFLEAMDNGDFGLAMRALNEAMAMMAPLANAQQYIAVADGAKLVKASELSVGNLLADVGEITDYDFQQCAADSCPGHVKLKIGTHELEFSGGQVLYVVDDPPGQTPDQ